MTLRSNQRMRPDAARALDEQLANAERAMDASFHVRLISTFDNELVHAPSDRYAAEWLENNHPEFDQFPVRHNDKTVGVLLRDGKHGSKKIVEAMEPLGEGLIVSADMPISELIPQLKSAHFRLVLRGYRVDGLVTQSDLIKLPVRMLLFGLLSHLEQGCRSLVATRMTTDQWLPLLTARRRAEVRREIELLSQARLDPDPLEFTNFGDLVRILSGMKGISRDFPVDLDELRCLRNDVAHGKTYIASSADVRRFVDRFDKMQAWIKRLPTLWLAHEHLLP